MDDLELADESLKSATLHQKYLNIYNNFRQLKLMNEGNYRVLYRKKWEYYSGKSREKSIVIIPLIHKILKQIYLSILNLMKNLSSKQKVEYNAMCMDSCERILKQIQQRGWDIKSAIEWRKFVDGAL